MKKKRRKRKLSEFLIAEKILTFTRLLGVNKLTAFILNEWLMDIKKNQLPSVMAGVGPMHSIIQLGNV